MITIRTLIGQPTVFVAELEGREVGRVSVSVSALVHDMEIESGMLKRKIAEALFQYASGYVRASGFSEALVMVARENVLMQAYIEGRTTPEEPSQAYLVKVQ